jgi:hypothetical protein
MNIYVDLDNTLCLTSGSDYENSQPIESRIVKVNNLKEQGNQIIIWTARGSNSGIDWSELTKNIDNGRPIVGYVGKHYILLIGYNGNFNKHVFIICMFEF